MGFLDDCDLTQGWNDTLCALGSGGIRRLLPVPLADIDESSITISTANVLTSATLVGKGGYLYILEQNLSSYTAFPSRSERGAVIWDITLNLVLNNDTAELRAELTRLGRQTLIWFAQKTDKTWVALGLTDGLKLNDGGEGGSGVAKTDPNGYTLPFIGQELYPPPDVAENVIDGLLADESSS